MASILTPSTFQIKLKEEHVVKGVKTLNETYFTLSDITNVDRRIVTVPPTTSIDIFNINGVNPSAGTFPSSSLKYARISNLDTTASLAVSFSSSESPEGERSYWAMNLLPTSSLMFSSSQVTGSSFEGLFGQDIEYVSVYAVSESIDVEYVVVNG
tara:strand:+ start:857 stop:1321 length:465 start_codon:yes stop_codon:yes gene_type:complete